MITYDEALNRLAERTVDNYRDNRRDMLQRRSEVVDLYGVEYTRDADGGAPANFYVSISPDLIYLERFAFKLIVQPFTSTVSGGTQSRVVSVNNARLNIDFENETLAPNPHSHTTEPHTHNLVQGVTLVNTTADDFRVNVAGKDITPYLMAQQGGGWINGEGIYPDAILGHEEDLYDILQVATDLADEGDEETANALLKPGYKRVQISSASPFRATLSLYLKYSHMNR